MFNNVSQNILRKCFMKYCLTDFTEMAVLQKFLFAARYTC